MLTAPSQPADHDDPGPAAARRRGPSLAAWVAIGFVGAFALAVLIPGTSLLEPDDYAYRAAILALSQGHLWLTNSQYVAMAHHFATLDGGHSMGIAQWVHMKDGTWISEKNPGYPFFAVAFQWLHLTRLIPVFYGALASVALYLGARRWIGAWGGTLAVGLFLSSGAALVFGWRWTMPTFTDASLVAIGIGLLLWSCLADDATRTRRGIVGMVGLLALDGAVFCRYTDVVVLLVAMAAIVLVSLLGKDVIPRRQLAWWLGVQVLVGVGLLGINAALYGSATKTGYSSGEITFSLHAISGNLSVMPGALVRAMPVLVVAILAIVVAPVLWLVRRRQPDRRSAATRDVLVVAVLGVMFLAVFGLYFCYDWTAQMGGHGGGPFGGHGGHAGGPDGGGGYVHLIRFYVPALAPMALLGAWLLTRIPTWIGFVVLAGLITMGAASYHTMSASGMGIGGFPGGGSGMVGGPGGPGGTHGATKAGCPSFPGGKDGRPGGFAPPSGANGSMRPPGFSGGTMPAFGGAGPGGGLPKIPKRCLPAGMAQPGR
jgi:hypothetical protein